MEQDKPYDEEATPEGVVGRRAPEEGNEVQHDTNEGYEGGQQVNLDELTDEEYTALVEQGLISDGDDGIIEIDPRELTGDDMGDPEEFPMLLPGDVVYARVHHPVRFDDDPSNFTYGVAARVQPGESEDDAFERIEPIVNTRALQLAQRAAGPVSAFKDAVNQARKEQVNDRRGLRRRTQEEGE
jgi:hypothetical protein